MVAGVDVNCFGNETKSAKKMTAVVKIVTGDEKLLTASLNKCRNSIKAVR
jgi:hypothetical protein